MDAAKLKSKKNKKSDFYYRLQGLNEKIFVYRSIFYSKVPGFHQNFLEKKKRAMEEKLAKEKANMIEEFKQIKNKRKLLK